METERSLAEYQTDHDLLVALNVRVEGLTKAVDKKNDDHEARIRVLETKVDTIQSSRRIWNYVVSITLGILGLIVVVIAAYISRN